ncbi:3-hydroxyacyl-CoA dehydrogenase/enoyl-CoA hydratase family protein [Leptothoe sp. PORK10 BA2]|uniref:3-hydroxyacyl-CoA dehydrogenase/enoyl-CoA hydratase family protein n=1 Tax=Leptothoe sp. PORK10 BA2 TaxID=3110254 RepID=UPI002B21E345|nr:3-hydroxyacyl-CoA dehydrogenase NAD-binding domain-containing protein [Leptothoe sp. PORK10 BA2]MEA5466895.1 3-hydroxyacyl-CoA dehydrogenase NAD-binding domain-containing protein [Leptothoe sp. PORK10 BA2]
MTFLPFKTAAVLGAGIMGTQIAAYLANAGLQVLLMDVPALEGDKNAVVVGAFKKAKKMSPPILFTPEVAHRIELGNYHEHFARLSQVDWVIEAVIERLDIKQELMARLEQVVRPNAVISTNTSGLPIAQIADGRSPDFRQRFLGTHFFNPPRYLKLLELIPTTETDPAITERMAWFGRSYLGKGVVIAKDTPNFIANRIGLFATFLGVHALTEDGYSIEEIDTLTGTLVGRPKSATFRTADLVGLDTLLHVAENIYPAIPHDEQRETFKLSTLLKTLVETGSLGAKAGQGFYKKVGKEILSVNPKTFDYEVPRQPNLPGLETVAPLPELIDRLRMLYKLPGRAGEFFRRTTMALLSYSACRLPEIADSPVAVDRAMRWGFGWQLGPFEMWDAIGFHQVLYDIQAANLTVPDWITEMAATGEGHFYRSQHGVPSNLLMADSVLGPVGQQEVEQPTDEIHLPLIKTVSSKIWENPEAALWDMGDGVVLYEFRSKGNTLSTTVVDGLQSVLDLLTQQDQYRGLVIGNHSEHFCGGANLLEMGTAAQTGDWQLIANLLVTFQTVLQRIRYFHKPIVAAVQGRALGGGCELVMACPHVVAAAESYIGLVEVSVGLIPGATGTTRMAKWAAQKAVGATAQHIQPFLNHVFKTVATATVAGSAHEAIELGFLPAHTHVVMNNDQRLYVAKEEVLCLDRAGYRPPARDSFWVLGQQGRAVLDHMAYTLEQGGFASDYDRFLAGRLAYVMTGGDLTSMARVSEEYLLGLEQEVFLPLLQNTKTQERILHLLKTKKPLRN